MTTNNFFVYCPNDGFDDFETLDDALDAAIERTREYLEDGWSEDVTSICVGRITHRAKMCDQVFPEGEIDEDGLDEAGEPWDPDCVYKCNYKMIAHPQPDSGDPWKATSKDYDLSIHSNPSAKAWADLFMTTFPDCGADPETMYGWFANAMMAMHDHLKNSQPAPDVAGLVDALDGAARSLETISRQAGIDEYMRDFSEVRGYARNRARVAFENAKENITKMCK